MNRKHINGWLRILNILPGAFPAIWQNSCHILALNDYPKKAFVLNKYTTANVTVFPTLVTQFMLVWNFPQCDWMISLTSYHLLACTDPSKKELAIISRST